MLDSSDLKKKKFVFHLSAQAIFDSLYYVSLAYTIYWTCLSMCIYLYCCFAWHILILNIRHIVV